jgi:hypothetical protein
VTRSGGVRGGYLALVASVAALAACSGRGGTSAAGTAQAWLRPVPTPAADRSGVCADVGAARFCWDDSGPPALVERTVPRTAATTPLGWRCAGPGPTRVCADRAAAAPAFACERARCRQRHARLPDDGEWTCVDSAGVVVCVGGERAAGIVAGSPEVGWLCGARSPRARDQLGARVCVDLSPDFPDGKDAGWRCRIENGAAPARVCERAASGAREGPALADGCDRARPCVDGATCVGGRCAPARPAPSCWLDADCATGACRFGTCRGQGAP